MSSTGPFVDLQPLSDHPKCEACGKAGDFEDHLRIEIRYRLLSNRICSEDWTDSVYFCGTGRCHAVFVQKMRSTFSTWLHQRLSSRR